ncbi:hypothetical protein K502DRAFT_248457 [Neoconidiobolus thromboides FSU 785]|nr:hypothetical protein K502DRAFT_248457 [Neoconidiobolus thromboides FSU 785]
MGMIFLISLLFPPFKRYLSGKFVSKILNHKNTSPYSVAKSEKICRIFPNEGDTLKQYKPLFTIYYCFQKTNFKRLPIRLIYAMENDS